MTDNVKQGIIMQNKIKEIEYKLSINKIIRMPNCKNITQELKNKIAQHNSNIVHNKKYVLLSNFSDSRNDLTILCPIHGKFEQRYSNHMKGQNCPKCSSESRKLQNTLTQDQAIKNMLKAQKGRYTYPRFIYIGAHDLSWVTCHKHGDFLQPYNIQLKGHGCPKCSNEYQTKEANLYILQNEHNHYKIGISNNVEKRINRLSKSINSFSEIVFIKSYNFDTFVEARKIESIVHKELIKYNIKHDIIFEGHTEWFSCSLEEIKETILATKQKHLNEFCI